MKKLITVVAGGGVLLLGACSNDSKDFKAAAESFIESSEVETQASTTFTDAACTEPAEIKAGATFTCTAVDADGATWDFNMELTSDNSFNLVGGQARP